MSSIALTKAVSRALASSFSYSYGSLIKPDVNAIPEESVRGSVPPPLSQWVLQGSSFESVLLEQYQRIRPGDTKLLIAATGIGKTTRLPLQLVMASGKAGLVLLPDVIPIVITLKYINEVVIPSFKQNVTVLPLRSQYVLAPKQGAVVYYSTAADFLPRYHADRQMVKRLNLDFIYMDEAHENHPAYHVMRMLVGMGFFMDTKVFLGTATSVGTSLQLTGTSNQVTPVACASSMFFIQNPEKTPMHSPLNFANITGRTMIFLPNDNAIDLWEAYYDGCDIRVITYHSYDTSTKIAVIETILKNPGPIAFLTNKRLQTGCTFSIDSVICCGYYEDFVVDYSVPAAHLEIRKVTKVMRTQRMGRVGRHMTGTAYYNDVTVSEPDPELTMTSAIYVWMWMKMFNVIVKNQEIAQFDDWLEEYSNDAISYLLCSRLHPALILPYMNGEGHLYKNWGILKSVFCTDKIIPETDESNEDSVKSWLKCNTGPQAWLQQPENFKTKTVFPDEWQALPLVAWKSYIGQDDGKLISDNVSVVSALVTGKPQHKKSVKMVRADTVKSSVATVVSRPKSIMTTRVPESPVWDKDEFPVVAEDESVDVPLVREVYKMPTRVTTIRDHVRASSSVTEEVQRTDNDIRQWVESSVKQTKHPKSHRSSGSSGSHDRLLVNLKKVSAMDYKMFKLYPMDTLLFSQYMSLEAAHRSDFKRYDSLIAVKENFSQLRGDSSERYELQNEYFLSVVRVHNHQVMEKLQIKASGPERPVLFSRMFGRDSTKNDEIIARSTRLLQGMQFEGFFVGIDRRTQHTSCGTFKPTTSKRLEESKVTARYLLSVADPNLLQTVHVMDSAVVGVLKVKEVVGTAWKIGRAVVLPMHVYENAHDNIEGHKTLVDESNDFVVVKTDEINTVHPRMRGPVDGEQVILVGIEPRTQDLICVGPSTVVCLGELWCIDKVLDFGYSGFALLSVEDSMVIGIYKGFYMELNGCEYSHFVPVDLFLAEIARIYDA